MTDSQVPLLVPRLVCRECCEDMNVARGRGLCARCYNHHHHAGTLGQFVQYSAPPLLDLSWHDDALCAQVDPEMFFPEKGGSTAEAKSVCARCLVRAECLDYAMGTVQRFGIWGGVSERRRRSLAALMAGDAA